MNEKLLLSLLLMKSCSSQVLATVIKMFKCSILYYELLYDWRESCLLIGLICLVNSLCLPGNWSKPIHKLILHENQLELVSRS